MKTNVGSTDKTIRIAAGVVIIALGLLLSSWWGLVGVVLLATGLMNFCPAYSLINFSTNKKVPTEKIK